MTTSQQLQYWSGRADIWLPSPFQARELHFFKPAKDAPSTSTQSSPNQQIWYGFYQDTYTYTEQGTKTVVNVKLLLDDTQPGTDKKSLSWYPEPHLTHTVQLKSGPFHIKVTFRSTRCTRLGNFSNNMCQQCADIPKSLSFRKRALLRQEKTGDDGKRDTSSIRDEYLTRTETQTKLKEQQKSMEAKDSQLFFLASKAARLSIRNRTYKEKVEEYAKRGSMPAFLPG